MSSWDERTKQHRIWEELRALGPTLDRAINEGDSSTDAISAIERIRVVLEFIGKRLASADPLLVASTPIEEIASLITSSRSEVDAYISNRNVAHLINANSHADRILMVSSQIPLIQSSQELQDLTAAINEYRTLYEQKTRGEYETVQKFTHERNFLDEKLDALRNDLEIERQKIAQIGIENQSQFASAQESRNLEFSQSELSRQTQHSQLLSRYDQELVARSAESTAKQKDISDQHMLAINLLDADYRAKAEEILKNIGNQRDEVEKLVGVIGNLGVTSGYLRAANHARWALWIWQLLTVGALTTLTILAYKTLPLLETGKGQFNWGGFAGRVLLLASLGVIAAYAGKQADKFFLDEKTNRKLALELEAIGPYLSSLPKEEQDKFKLLVGERSFGRDISSYLHQNSKSPVNVVDVLNSKEAKEFLALIIDIGKKLK